MMRTLLVASLLSTWAGESAVAQQRPTNVIFLLVDDWGWTDAGCFGSDLFLTPNIDRLAATGTKFTNAYAACTVCSPTRAAAMTGMYPARTRVTDWIPGHRRKAAPLAPPDWTQRLEHRHTTIAEALRAAGYRTAHIGKWHLTPRSSDREIVAPYYPERHGFEINVAGNQWGAPGTYHWPFARRNRRTKKVAPGLQSRTANFPKGGEQGDYLTDTLTDHAVRWIGEFKDEPFFLYLPYYAVHTPIQGRADLKGRYEKLLREEPNRRHGNAGYAAMVTAVDESVGRIMRALEHHGIADDTVIILTGDNGGLLRVTDNAPLRAGKGSAYEGGVRVPCIVRAPGLTKPGTTSKEPIITVDFYPTILGLTGVKGSAEHNASVDGADLAPVLRDPAKRLAREAIFWHYPHYHPGGATPYGAIRMRDWKLIEFQEDGRVELYHLSDDIGESRNVATQHPAKAAELRGRLHTWQKQVRAQRAVPNPQAKKNR